MYGINYQQSVYVLIGVMAITMDLVRIGFRVVPICRICRYMVLGPG